MAAPGWLAVAKTGDRNTASRCDSNINARSEWWAGSFGVLDSAGPELAAYLIERGAIVDAHSAARLGMFDKLRRHSTTVIPNFKNGPAIAAAGLNPDFAVPPGRIVSIKYQVRQHALDPGFIYSQIRQRLQIFNDLHRFPLFHIAVLGGARKLALFQGFRDEA